MAIVRLAMHTGVQAEPLVVGAQLSRSLRWAQRPPDPPASALCATPADFYDTRAGYQGKGVGTPTKGQSVTPYNWQSGMHRVKFEGGKLKEIRIFPVDVGYGKPRWQ